MEIIDDPEFEAMWRRGEARRRARRNFIAYTETMPHNLKRLGKAIEAFGKIKLNDRGLPW